MDSTSQGMAAASQRTLLFRIKAALHERWAAMLEWLGSPHAVWTVWRYSITRNALPFTAQTLKPLPAQPPADATRLVFFAHYDPFGEVDEYVYYYLQQLHASGCAILFVSGNPRLKAASVEKILPLCAGVFSQQTRSLDFGSWNLAWQHMQHRGWSLNSFQQFILANDSVYGPLFPLEEMLGAFIDADMYGMTDSNERGHHLQSFFLQWDLNARTKLFVEDFWRRFRYVVRKQRLIDKYETGISRAARKAGLRLKAYASDAAVRSAFLQRHPHHEHAERIAKGSVNNTLLLWDVLLEDFRCPLLKTDLPRRNRYGSRKIEALSAELQQWTEYDPALIERNLRRLATKPHDVATS